MSVRCRASSALLCSRQLSFLPVPHDTLIASCCTGHLVRISEVFVGEMGGCAEAETRNELEV